MGEKLKFKIQKQYNNLRPSEKKVADYFLQYKYNNLDLLIENVSNEVGVSQPTVIRFVKAMGFKGFKEFKMAFIQECMKENISDKKDQLYGFEINKSDNIEDIPGKIIGTSINMLEETLKSIDVKAFKETVDAILNAENIVIYSVENSNCTASDLMMKLVYLGLNCRMYSDYYIQQVSANNLTSNDLAIGISYSGYSIDTVEMMKVAKRAGAKTVAITNFENAKINKYADIVISTSNKQFLYGNTIFSRTCQLAIVDMIYVGIINRDYERRYKNLSRNSRVVSKRAYNDD